MNSFILSFFKRSLICGAIVFGAFLNAGNFSWARNVASEHLPLGTGYIVTFQERFGDWTLQCRKKTEPVAVDNSICFISTTVKNKSGNVYRLDISYEALDDGKKFLNIHHILSRQLKPEEQGAMVFDNDVLYNIKIKKCVDLGCYVTERISNDNDFKQKYLGYYRKGNRARFGYQWTGKPDDLYPISLKGFSAAHNKLEEFEETPIASGEEGDSGSLSSTELLKRLAPFTTLLSVQSLKGCVDENLKAADRVEKCLVLSQSGRFSPAITAVILGWQARQYRAAGYPEKAIETLDAALALDPDNMANLIERSMAKGLVGDDAGKQEDGKRFLARSATLLNSESVLAQNALHNVAQRMRLTAYQQLLDRRYQCERALDASLEKYSDNPEHKFFVDAIFTLGRGSAICQKLLKTPIVEAEGQESPGLTPEQLQIKKNAEAIARAAAMTDLNVCLNAMQSGLTDWETGKNFAAFVEEAKKRRLDPASCRKLKDAVPVSGQISDAPTASPSVQSADNENSQVAPAANRRQEASDIILAIMDFNKLPSSGPGNLEVARLAVQLTQPALAQDSHAFSTMLDNLIEKAKADQPLWTFIETRRAELQKDEAAKIDKLISVTMIRAEFSQYFATRNLAHPAALDLIDFVDRAKSVVAGRDLTELQSLEAAMNGLNDKWQLRSEFNAFVKEKCKSSHMPGCDSQSD